MPLLQLALLGWLAACQDDTGNFCQDDYACQSNRCTGNSCASPWADELVEAFQDGDTPPSGTSSKPCWEQAADECRLSRDPSACARVETFRRR